MRNSRGVYWRYFPLEWRMLTTRSLCARATYWSFWFIKTWFSSIEHAYVHLNGGECSERRTFGSIQVHVRVLIGGNQSLINQILSVRSLATPGAGVVIVLHSSGKYRQDTPLDAHADLAEEDANVNIRGGEPRRARAIRILSSTYPPTTARYHRTYAVSIKIRVCWRYFFT